MNSLKRPYNHILIVLLLMLSVNVSFAEEISLADLSGKDKESFDKFRRLFTSKETTPEQFYSYAEKYEKELLERKYMNLYYKLKNNEGFFALHHGQLFRAIAIAQDLEEIVKKDEAEDYYYLPTGLLGDVYCASHNVRRAKQYYKQALEQVGSRDSKFTMRVYHSLAEMLSLSDPKAALEWSDLAINMSIDTRNVEYLSLSYAMKAYVYFLAGNASEFYSLHDKYVSLRSQEDTTFNHRYDNIMEAARRAFDRDYEGALNKLHEGSLNVDSSLCVIRVMAMDGDIDQGFEAMRRKNIEMDSIYSIAQETNFDELVMERSLLHSREEARNNKQLARRLTNWMIILTLVYLFVYIMGRRRLVRKIWASNKELKNALEKAKESERMKSSFIKNMSHEIRTPLNAVAGFSQLLCNTDLELSAEEKQDMQQRISSNVEQITGIVGELLEMSKSESEHILLDIEKTEIMCNDLCRKAIGSMKSKFKDEVQMRFSSNVPDDFTIVTDGQRLRRSLIHLLDNALKFTDKGSVTVRVERHGHELGISVSDTGVGIDPSNANKIFDTFSKIDDFKEGIGLGLPICQRLIGSLGGRIILDTDYTEGARFVIYLPI